MALGRRHGFNAGADDVVVRHPGLRGSIRWSDNGCEAQALRVLGASACIILAQSKRAARILATSMKKFMPIAQKNDSAARRIDRHAGSLPCADIFNAVRECVAKLQIRRRSGFLHVVAGDLKWS